MEKIISTSRSHRGFIWTLVVIAIFGVGLTFTNYRAHAESTESAGGRVITLHDSGTERGFITKKTTLREAFAEQEIRLDANDRTEPGLDEPLVAGSYQVNVYRARAVVIKDGALRTKLITSYRTGKQIMEQAKLAFQPEDTLKLSLSTDPIADGAAEVLTVTRAIEFNFVFYGKAKMGYTMARTVGEMLKEKGITMGDADGISPELSTPISAGMTIKLWRDGTQTVTIEEGIAFSTRQIRDADRDRTYKEVQSAGENGLRIVTYEITTKDGVEVERKEVNSNVVKRPVEQVEVVGVKGVYTSPSENQRLTWEFLMSKGLTREQTAGIMGNLQQEHGFNTSGDGLAQWTGSRKANLLSRPDPYSIYTQLDFLWYELSGPYSRVLSNIQAQNSVEGSVVIFQNQYERCGVCAESRRIQFAYNILESH